MAAKEFKLIHTVTLNTLYIYTLYEPKARNVENGITTVFCQIPELKVLWEMIEDSSESAARLCCQCLVQLVFDGYADLDYILKGLLNAVPSVR